MKQALNDSILFVVLVVIIVALVITLIVLIIQAICRSVADNYIDKKRKSLFNKTRPLSDKCVEAGNKLLNELRTYWAYIDELGLDQEYTCSSSVVSNASNNVVKYLIKYSDIGYDQDTLEKIDFCIRYLHLYEQMMDDMEILEDDISEYLPAHVRMFALKNKIPYKVCDISYKLAENVEPEFSFLYVSPAGRSERAFDINITPSLLSKVESEIYKKLDKKGFSTTQRQMMTNDLREAIKKRDNYTCCICGNSVFNEPNLLLEVDHIVPISKGGKTEASNLQTLCWRCNRSKSNKM